MTDLLEEAADALERRLFFDQLDAGFAALRHDRVAWSEVDAEREVEARSLGDTSA